MLPPIELKNFSLSALATIASGSNIYFWHAVDYFDKTGAHWPLLMTWTLGVEEQFYLLFPMLMLAMRKMSWKAQFAGIASLAALSIAVSVWAARSHPEAAFYLLPARAWELAAGVLLAILEANRAHARTARPAWTSHSMSMLGLGLIGVAVVFPEIRIWFPGFAALPAVAGAVMTIAARDGVANRALAMRPLVFIGLVSYSWYLWHWPMFSFARIVLLANGSETLGVTIACASLVLAVLSYKFIEQPFRGSVTPAGLLLKRYGAVLVIAALPALLICATNGLPQRNRTAQAVEMTAMQLKLDPCLVLSKDPDIPMQAPCAPQGEGPAVALIGDSHAGSIAGPLRNLSVRAGYRFIQLTKPDCLALDDHSALFAGQTDFTPDCVQFNQERIDYILREPSIQKVVIGGFWSSCLEPAPLAAGAREEGQSSEPAIGAPDRSALQEGLDRLVVRLRDAGKSVYLVTDNPTFSFDPAGVLYNRLFWSRRAVAKALSPPTLHYEDGVAPDLATPAVQVARQVLEKITAAHPGTVLIDMYGALCSARGCRFADGDQTLYFGDKDHLSGPGATAALKGFGFE
jgi:peptidoglycan/LPS O-acetylase OafA/YrhL